MRCSRNRGLEFNKNFSFQCIGNPIIVFRPDIDLSHENDETYTGKLDTLDELKIWAQDKCVPLVR